MTTTLNQAQKQLEALRARQAHRERSTLDLESMSEAELDTFIDNLMIAEVERRFRQQFDHWPPAVADLESIGQKPDLKNHSQIRGELEAELDAEISQNE